jgi:hypothetical protein
VGARSDSQLVDEVQPKVHAFATFKSLREAIFLLTLGSGLRRRDAQLLRQEIAAFAMRKA